MSVFNNPNKFQSNFSIHDINMRHKNQLHIPLVKLSSIRIGVTYSSIKIFNVLLPSVLKFQKDKSIFKSSLRKCFVMHTFYSVEEFGSLFISFIVFL